MEALSNKIGAMQRQAFGYRDAEYFVLKIYGQHMVKYALAG